MTSEVNPLCQESLSETRPRKSWDPRLSPNFHETLFQTEKRTDYMQMWLLFIGAVTLSLSGVVNFLVGFCDSGSVGGSVWYGTKCRPSPAGRAMYWRALGYSLRAWPDQTPPFENQNLNNIPSKITNVFINNICAVFWSISPQNQHEVNN